MSQFHGDLGGRGILRFVRLMLYQRQRKPIEIARVGMDMQLRLCPGHADIHYAFFLVRGKIIAVQEHENGIELPAFGLVNGGNQHRVPAAFDKVLRLGFMHIFQQVRAVFRLIDFGKGVHQAQAQGETGASFVGLRHAASGALPAVFIDHRRGAVFRRRIQKTADFRQVEQVKAVQRLNQPGGNALPGQQSGDPERLFIGGCQDAAAPLPGGFQVRRQRNLQTVPPVLCNDNLPRLGVDSPDLRRFHPPRDAGGKGVCQLYDTLFTSEIVRHFIACRAVIRNQGFHIRCVRTAEGVDILVVISHGDDPHALVPLHQGADERKLVLIHILGFVNDQDRFGHAARLHAPALYHAVSGV